MSETCSCEAWQNASPLEASGLALVSPRRGLYAL